MWIGGWGLITAALAEDALVIHAGHAVDPPIVGLYRTAEANTVLLNDISKRHHLPLRKFERRHGPIVETLPPQVAPGAERGAEVFQALERKKIGT